MYRRILVGTDGSATAARAVDRAVEVASATGADLTIASIGNGDEPARIASLEAGRHGGSGVAITTAARAGDPATALVDLAQQGGYDLLVVGNKGMTGISRVLGSVPNKVSHHAPVALLIVKTTG